MLVAHPIDIALVYKHDMLPYAEHRVHVMGVDYGRYVVLVFQGSALFDNETVLGNVMFPLKMFSDMTRAQMLDRARFCLNRVNLNGAESKYPSEISGGMQKRVAIARAIG